MLRDRVMRWAALTALLVLGSCNGSGKPAADVLRPAEGLTGEGPSTEKIVDRAKKLEAGGLPCLTACGPNEVCDNGTCRVPGPTKTCPSTYSLSGPDVIYVGPPPIGGGPNYKTIKEALAAAKAGAKIAIAAGTYADPLDITKSVELHCACHTAVAISGKATIINSGSTAVRVTIDGCTLSLNGLASLTSWGICTPPPPSDEPMAIEVKGQGAVDLLVRDSVIAGWCTGIYFIPNNAASSLCIARSRLTANVKGLAVVEAPLGAQVAEECKGVVAPVVGRLNRIDQNQDFGIYKHEGALGIGLQANLVELTGTIAGKAGGRGYGVYFGDTDGAIVEHNVFRKNENVALGMRNLAGHAAGADLKILENIFDANRGAAIALQQLQATKPVAVSRNIVKDTKALDVELAKALGLVPGGDGIQASIDNGTAYKIDFSNNTITASARNGILLDGVGGSVEANTITGSAGFGVLAQQGSTVQVKSNTYSGNAAGDFKAAPSVIDLHADLPVPQP